MTNNEMQSDADVVGGGVMTGAPPKWRPPSGNDHEAHSWMTRRALEFGERLGSGDGERKTLLTRQIAFEPLPASVLFALGCFVVAAAHVFWGWGLSHH